MTSGAEELEAFEAAGWSRRANTYGRVTGAIAVRFVDPGLEDVAVGTVAVRHRVEGEGHELPAVAKVGSARRP
jgi:hypothetical protein